MVALDLAGGQTLTATYEQIGGDAVMYLFNPGCDADQLLAWSDETFFGEQEQLSFVSPYDGAGVPGARRLRHVRAVLPWSIELQ